MDVLGICCTQNKHGSNDIHWALNPLLPDYAF